ncbi:MAG: pitrilysin family protein [Phycisphaerales bacterium]|jgi:predicted Zn-dependent peptidase|nr:pitrilysin family protein [Phycisphaerales bacterium]
MKRHVTRFLLLTTAFLFVQSAKAQQVSPDIFILDNGMKFILLPRTAEPNSVAAGWVAKVGSVNERPGITGLSHYFEHLMFKGTDTIGTSDAERDSAFTEKESELRNQMLHIVWGEQYDRFKRGEIDDPWDEQYDTPQLSALRKELIETMNEHRSVIVKDEFSSVYQKAGAVGMNAFTSEDITFYINGLPANKIELWCWMESDRLQNSVFREFFSERDVVHEERRMRTEASPTGEFDEQFNSMFWQASPYSWPVIGWPSDLNSYTLDEAKRYFDIYYRPNNLIGVLVGDFDLDKTKGLIQQYFGRLERGTTPPPPVPTIEPRQKAPQRLVGEVDAQSQVEVRYHAVPFGHKDAYALEVLSAVLNGRTGRLFKNMVEGEEIAADAGVRFDGKKYAGAFSFYATVKGDTEPEELERAWYVELERLKNEPVSDRELQKVKNNIVADQYRGLQSNFYLMIQLGFFEMFGNWDYINTAAGDLLDVTKEDILSVANKYFDLTNSSVAVYRRSVDAEPIDEELLEFSPQQLAIIKQALGELESVPVEELAPALADMRTQAAQVPPEFKPVFEYLLKKLEDRVNETLNEESNE